MGSDWRQRRVRSASQALLLVVLLPVPFVLAWAASPSVYPPINPDSGGPTGASLLGSVLGMVALFAITPWMLGLETRRRGIAWFTVACLAVHSVIFLLIGHGNHSNHEPIQIAALASTLLWPPLLALHLRQFSWPAMSTGWLLSSLGWGLALALSGVIAFLPGVLESWKFSSALVAHAHLAMAGLVTAWNMLVLTVILRDSRAAMILSCRVSTWTWNLGLAVHLLALAGLAVLEMHSPGGLLPGSMPTHVPSQMLLALRLVAGLAQLIVASWWLLEAMRDPTAATVEI